MSHWATLIEWTNEPKKTFFFSSIVSSMKYILAQNVTPFSRMKEEKVREISRGKCRKHVVPAASTEVWELQPSRHCAVPMIALTSFPAALSSLGFWFWFLTLTTNKDQTQKPVIIPIPKRVMDELVSWSFLGWLWPKVHLSAEHWGEKQKKSNSSSVFTLKVAQLQLCSQTHCSQTDWN